MIKLELTGDERRDLVTALGNTIDGYHRDIEALRGIALYVSTRVAAEEDLVRRIRIVERLLDKAMRATQEEGK